MSSSEMTNVSEILSKVEKRWKAIKPKQYWADQNQNGAAGKYQSIVLKQNKTEQNQFMFISNSKRTYWNIWVKYVIMIDHQV